MTRTPENPSARSEERIGSSGVRIGLLIPSLLFGGGERWSLDIARFCDPSLITWTGCVVTQSRWVEPGMLSAMAALMPTYSGRMVWERGECHPATSEAAVARLLGSADVVVTWEVDQLMRSILDDLRTCVVNVAHRHDPDSLGAYLDEDDLLMTVWPSNLSAFGAECKHRVGVIPNGIDLNRCTPIRDRQQMRISWACVEADVVIGYIGRIHPQKDCVAIAKAVRGLGNGAIGVVVGSRCKETGEVEAAMRGLAGDRIRVLPPVEDIGSVLSALDVFFLPSPAEVFSLSLLEAWAARTPVVATRVGAVPDLEAEAGPLVVPIAVNADARELANAIRFAVSGAPEISEMCARAEALVRTRFGVRRMANFWTDYLVSCQEHRCRNAAKRTGS